VSTGAADDLAKASDIARSIAAQYGMVASLGEVAYDRQRMQLLDNGPQPSAWFERSYAKATAREIDCAVRQQVTRASERAAAVLGANRDLLERGARLLLDRETLSGADLQDLLAGAGPRLISAA
jgi:cell division protease FtsH